MELLDVWLEYKDTDGKCYMIPATPDEVRELLKFIAQDENETPAGRG